MTAPAEFGLRRRAKATMRRLGLSRADMGDLLGVTRQAFSQWLARSPKPLDRRIHRLLNELDAAATEANGGRQQDFSDFHAQPLGTAETAGIFGDMPAVNVTAETLEDVRTARAATGKSHYRIVAEAMELWAAVHLPPQSPSSGATAPAPMAPSGSESQAEHSTA